MSIAYFDASAVLAFLLQQPDGDSALAAWVDSEQRVSSVLLKAECLVSLRRILGRMPDAQEQMGQRLQLLASRMEEISLSDVDGSILSVLERQSGLADCRTLDALHVATALHIQERTGERVSLVSLDERMRVVAGKSGLNVFPA